MRQARSQVIARAIEKNLRLVFEPAEGAGMNHAVAVALENIAVGVFGFGVSPPPASLYRKSQARQHEKAAGY
jgi:hypothetical protein